jgi:putative ABC transport system substrate-binding protein
MERLRVFRQGLKEAGYVEGENVSIEYRWAENQWVGCRSWLPIWFAAGSPSSLRPGPNLSAFAAKAATTTIPIVFIVSDDPGPTFGLVISLARPSANLTGINFLNAELAAKRLESVASACATRFAWRAGQPNECCDHGNHVARFGSAAQTMGLQIQVGRARTSREINEAFTAFANERPHALFVAQDGLFSARRVHLAQLTTRYVIPAAYGSRDFAEAGGLMSYGANIVDAYRQVGAYTGRILKGAKPVDLPVVQSSKFELVLNAETARTLGLAIPPSLLAIADEVIE